jgi:hypothetical protein
MKNFKKTARQTTGNGNALNAEGLFSLERELDDLTPAEQEGFSQKMTAEEAARIARVLLTERDNSLLTPAYNILERVTARNIDLVSAILPVALEGVRLRKEDGEKAVMAAVGEPCGFLCSAPKKARKTGRGRFCGGFDRPWRSALDCSRGFFGNRDSGG